MTHQEPKFGQSQEQIAAPGENSKQALNEKEGGPTALWREMRSHNSQHYLELLIQHVRDYTKEPLDKDVRLNCANDAVVSFFRQVIELLPEQLQDGSKKLLELRETYWNERFSWQLEKLNEIVQQARIETQQESQEILHQDIPEKLEDTPDLDFDR